MKNSLIAPTLRRALIVVALLTALAAMGIFAAPSTDAAAGSNCTYYSNASKTTVVGQYGYDCCNNRVAWGIKTQYSTCSSACFICYPPPR